MSYAKNRKASKPEARRKQQSLWLDAPTGVHNLKFRGKPHLIWHRVEDNAFHCSCNMFVV
jgi:hypothetical protein